MLARFMFAGMFFSSVAIAGDYAFYENIGTEIETDTEMEALLRMDGNGKFMDQQLRVDFEIKLKLKRNTTNPVAEDSEIDLLDSFADKPQSEVESEELDLLDSFAGGAVIENDIQDEDADLLDSFAGGSDVENNNQDEDADLLDSFADGTITESDSQAEDSSFGQEKTVTALRLPEFQLRLLAIIDPASSEPDRVNQVKLFSGGVKFFAGEQHSLFLGKESYIWGKADGINPVDVNNADDFTEFLLKDQDRRKLPRYLLKYNFVHQDHNFQFLYMPGYVQNVLPDKESRWCQTLCQVATPVDQLPTETQPGITVIDDLNRSSLKFSEYSLRYASRTDWLDYSLVVHNGFDKYPVFKRQFTSANSAILERLLVRRWSFGGDVAFTVDDFGIRVEARFQPDSILHFKQSSAEFFTDDDGIKEVNQLNWIIGIDWVSSVDTYVNFQISQNHYFDDDDFFRNAFEIISTLQISQRFFDDDFEANILFYYEYSDNSYAINPEISYQFNDQLALTLGGFFFAGKPATFFGDYGDNSNVFTKLVYAF